MNVNEVLLDLFGRVVEEVATVLDGLDPRLLDVQPEPGTNPIGWLVWHLTRVQDYYIAGFLGEDQVWARDGWAARFGLAPDPGNVGYGHGPQEMSAVRPDGPDALRDYFAAVWARTRPYLERVTEAELDRIVDRAWDPPVSLGARLISIADDDIQHAGQAAYARGTLERR
jgi:hypothetical protein